MANHLTFGQQQNDSDWACTHHEIEVGALADKISVCQVHISDILKTAEQLTASVMDDSWVMEIDSGARRSYLRTVKDTAERLIEVFKHVAGSNTVASKFGEIMVSMGASRALEILFSHKSLPLAELWKPQKGQNEGFDFHTVCGEQLINFGEAKYIAKRSGSSPYKGASEQANDFIEDEKHFRDRVHLINLVHKEAINNLDSEKFGVIAAFSINAQNPLTAFNNAITLACGLPMANKADRIYLVGVSHAD